MVLVRRNHHRKISVDIYHANIVTPGDQSGEDITQRILRQRMGRFDDAGPDLWPAGAARYRFDDGRLRIAFAEMMPGSAALAVELAQRYVRARNLALYWIVVPQRTGEGELPAALRSAHFRVYEHLLLMARRQHALPMARADVTVEPISTWPAMCEYEYGSRQAFQEDPAPTHAAVTQRARERWRDQEYGWCAYYAARLDGRQVAGLYVTRYEEIPTIMGVYTTADVRGRGVATALLSRVVTDLASNGSPACCLFVRYGNPAERVYRRLGFVPLVDEDTYIWEPESRRA
jgi:GNAT superfamily N-acetyltransferase